MKAKNIIKIYGTDSNVQQLVVSGIKNYLKLAQLNYSIQKITDVSTFLELKLKSIPSIQLNDGEIYPVKKGNFLKQNLRRALSRILAKDNFGNLKKIIVPIDFSESSTNAFMFAHRLATDMNAVTQVIHVDSPNGSNAIKAKFNAFINQVDTDWGGDFLKASLIDQVYLNGDINEVLLKQIQLNKPEFVVSGINGLGKKNIGSVSQNLLQNSSTNVLMIPSGAKYTKDKSIYIPYSNCNYLEKVSDSITSFCTSTHSTLNLIKLSESQSNIKCNLNAFLNFNPDRINQQDISSRNLPLFINELNTNNKTDILGITDENFENLLSTKNNQFDNILNPKSKMPILIIK